MTGNLNTKEFPDNVRFQLKGRRHITYINEAATQIWLKSNFTIPYNVCLLEAFRKHLAYLKRENNDAPYLSRWNNE